MSEEQLNFVFGTGVPRSKRLDAAVQRHLPDHRVQLTDAKTVLLSASRKKARVHQMFLDGDDEVMDAVGRFLKSGDKRAARLLDAFIAEHEHLLDPSPDVTPEDAVGAHHDLRSIFFILNRRYFDSELDAQIAWGKRNAPVRGKTRSSITLGSYDYRANLVTVHPVLDQAFVPPTAVARVVHHEMCHARHPAKKTPGGRRLVHTAEFRVEEARYEDAEGADAWIDAHLERLLAWSPG